MQLNVDATPLRINKNRLIHCNLAKHFQTIVLRNTSVKSTFDLSFLMYTVLMM